MLNEADEQSIKQQQRKLIIMIIVCLCFALLGVFHSSNGIVHEIQSIYYSETSENFETYSNEWNVNCISNFELKNINNPSFKYRFSHFNTSDTSPVGIFPFPKILLESSKEAESSRKLLLNHHYSFHIYQYSLLDQYAKTAVTRFCGTHKNMILESAAKEPESTSFLQTIDIIFSNGSIDSFVSNKEAYQIPYSNAEAYLLTIATNGTVQLIVNSEFGINHGLSTLSQLIFSLSSYALPLEIIDWPESEWRGNLFSFSIFKIVFNLFFLLR